MASDYSFPASRPYPGWGPGPNTSPEAPQTPLSGVMDKLQAYTPDVYTTPPPVTQPLHPFPMQVMQPSRLVRRTSRPESPAQVGRSPSRSAWSATPVPEGPSPIQKTYKTFLQWKADAQETTAECLRNGFPSPVAWVYVEGHGIPPNAIIGGVDRRGPWHIARTFYEGTMELGKAGRHFRLGACISYHGKERDVDTYEVLVEVNIPTRWVYQPLPTSLPSTAASQVTLADFKLVVIVDDSDSMYGRLWSEARDALAGVAELSRQKGGEGLDIYFLNSSRYRLDLQGGTEVRNFFSDIVPEGQTPTGARLKQVLDIYVPKIENPALQHKPITILVITDGIPTDDPRSVIIDFARRLDVKSVPLRQLGIQFVQIGDDPNATDALKELDDNLGPVHGIRDMVHTTPFNQAESQLRAEVIVKILLGSTAIPRPTVNPQVTLADFKLVVIIDDSDSMYGSLWSEARDALAGVAELSCLKGGEGLDLYCLNSPQYRLDLRAESAVRNFFNNITPEGQTPIGAKLKQILDIYVPRVEDTALRHKPISILVITDGVPTDDPQSVIVNCARRLDAKNIPLRQLGIQFVQIGDDPNATAALKELDDKLGPTYGVRDMVDTTLFNQTQPQLRADVIIKIVLGSINATLDQVEFPAPLPY